MWVTLYASSLASYTLLARSRSPETAKISLKMNVENITPKTNPEIAPVIHPRSPQVNRPGKPSVCPPGALLASPRPPETTKIGLEMNIEKNIPHLFENILEIAKAETPKSNAFYFLLPPKTFSFLPSPEH